MKGHCFLLFAKMLPFQFDFVSPGGLVELTLDQVLESLDFGLSSLLSLEPMMVHLMGQPDWPGVPVNIICVCKLVSRQDEHSNWWTL